MTRTPISAAVVGLLVLALAAPASATDDEHRREVAQAKRAQVAAQLNVLKASDDQLVGAVRALDSGIAVQTASSAAAEADLRAAHARAGSAQAELAATESRMAILRVQVGAAAVRAYVHPGGSGLFEMIRSRDFGEASRRKALLSQAVSSDRDVLEAMRAARQDQQSDRANVLAARAQAAARARAVADKVASLKRTQADQRRLSSALQKRIVAAQSESDALSREEARLNAIIKSRIQGGTGATKISGSGYAWPASGSVTSRFGQRWGRMHTGIDIASRSGTPIKAARAGRVVLAGYNGGYGNAVVIDHGGGYSTLYAHMSRLRVSDGATVKQGQQVGDMGSTGSSTGTHVHFEVRSGGSAVNPSRFLP
ncbi:MAG: murein hydrolase activator EnvC family protein [Acidimicrobiales bacterium]